MNGRTVNLDVLLNRLVDGELTDEEYREVLTMLDSQPEGWRRCAMAFLEAQAWGSEFNALRAESAQPVPAKNPVSGSVATPKTRWSWYYSGIMALACAASFLFAFGVSDWWYGRAVPSPHQIVGVTPRMEDAHSAPGSLVSDVDSHPQDGQIASPVGRYQLVVKHNASQPETVEMPVFAADDPRAGVLLDEYATMPRELIRALESRGNHVQRQRNWIPMPGSSNVPVYVPVDEIQVTPVSSRSFQ